MQPVFRFAPSPNGFLHLGHAYSALLNAQLARETDGRFLVRIEDIDTIRCKPALIAAALEDLDWLGLRWEEPVLQQSTQFSRYAAVLDDLEWRGLAYRCTCSRKTLAGRVAELEAEQGTPWPRDPDGSPLYPGTCRHAPALRAGNRDEPHCLRLDLGAALDHLGRPELSWLEQGSGLVTAHPEQWGDIVLGRKETPASYHLAVVLDDALQGVTHVVRGQDLFHATAIHRLLQDLLGLPAPRYRHHPLLLDEVGQKLAKSRYSTPLRQLRAEGVSADAIRARFGFS